MPTTAAVKPKPARPPKTTSAKPAAKHRKIRSPSFGEWVKKYAGIVKNAPSDLSMREGFGD